METANWLVFQIEPYYRKAWKRCELKDNFLNDGNDWNRKFGNALWTGAWVGGHVAIWNYYRALKVPGSILSAPTALRFIALGSGFGAVYYSAYTATVHGMAQLRDKKDGLLNHFMGGLAVGTIYSLKVNDPTMIPKVGLHLGVLAVIFKALYKYDQWHLINKSAPYRSSWSYNPWASEKILEFDKDNAYGSKISKVSELAVVLDK